MAKMKVGLKATKNVTVFLTALVKLEDNKWLSLIFILKCVL